MPSTTEPCAACNAFLSDPVKSPHANMSRGETHEGPSMGSAGRDNWTEWSCTTCGQRFAQGGRLDPGWSAYEPESREEREAAQHGVMEVLHQMVEEEARRKLPDPGPEGVAYRAVEAGFNPNRYAGWCSNRHNARVAPGAGFYKKEASGTLLVCAACASTMFPPRL